MVPKSPSRIGGIVLILLYKIYNKWHKFKYNFVVLLVTNKYRKARDITLISQTHGPIIDKKIMII